MNILVVNCGSSSIKYLLHAMPDNKPLARGSRQRITDHAQAMTQILASLTDGDNATITDVSEITAVGHRVVHGGDGFCGAVVIDQDVIQAIERFADLAPLHNPPNLVGIRAAQSAAPHAVHVACFDTAFHQSMPPVAYTYALPHKLCERYGIRRYGFHGTSHRYVVRRAAEQLNRGVSDVNCITCHLGNGCSIAAVRGGVCVDTSMGFTPLEGVVMGTRCGDIDPAILFHLADKGYTPAQLRDLCNTQSGLLGLSGVSNDMREVEAAAADGDERARLAIDVFCYRIRKYIGAYTAVLGRVDALVFTGGIGEASATVREGVCTGLECLGITAEKVMVIPTDEEVAIAADVYELLNAG